MCSADYVCEVTPGNVVFVADPSGTNGDLGGVGGGNSICSTAAAAAGLPGNFLAWLSDSNGNSPQARFTPLTTPYTLPDGTEIAASWAGLTSGTLLHAIDESASGQSITSTCVWTGTTANGTSSGADCSGWTVGTNAADGREGVTFMTASAWTSDAIFTCQQQCALYCVQQGNIIFVADASMETGNFGGVPSANSICQTAATEAGLTGTFRAWVSDSQGDFPANTFNQLTTPYTLVDGTPIAASYAGLTSGTLENGIDEDATGAVVAGYAWTGTNADGTASANNCDTWTDDDGSAMGGVGVLGDKTFAWTANGTISCLNLEAIICVQQ